MDLVRRLTSSAPPIKTSVFSTTPRARSHPLEFSSDLGSKPESEPVHILDWTALSSSLKPEDSSRHQSTTYTLLNSTIANYIISPSVRAISTLRMKKKSTHLFLNFRSVQILKNKKWKIWKISKGKFLSHPQWRSCGIKTTEQASLSHVRVGVLAVGPICSCEPIPTAPLILLLPLLSGLLIMKPKLVHGPWSPFTCSFLSSFYLLIHFFFWIMRETCKSHLRNNPY